MIVLLSVALAAPGSDQLPEARRLLAGASAPAVTLTAAPSIFQLPDLCAPKAEAADACHVAFGGIACSAQAVEDLAAMDPAGTADRPSVPLLYVLAHELSHLAHADDDLSPSVRPLARGPTESRYDTLVAWMEQGSAQRRVEARADAEAADRLAAVLASAPYGRTSVDRLADWYSLGTLFTSAPGSQDCLGGDDLSIPPDAAYLRKKSRALLDAVRRAPEGTPLPVLLGSHPDWGGRLAVVSNRLLPRSEIPALLDGAPDGMRSAVQLALQTSDILRFQAEGLESYYEALAAAIRAARAP